MLMRLWFRPSPPAADLDLVCTLPFNVEETGRRLIPVLADRTIDDGVTFGLTGTASTVSGWTRNFQECACCFRQGRVAR